MRARTAVYTLALVIYIVTMVTPHSEDLTDRDLPLSSCLRDSGFLGKLRSPRNRYGFSAFSPPPRACSFFGHCSMCAILDADVRTAGNLNGRFSQLLVDPLCVLRLLGSDLDRGTRLIATKAQLSSTRIGSVRRPGRSIRVCLLTT